MNTPLDVLHILDPVSEGYNSLRSWILPGLMQTLQVNRTNEYPQRIFEIGSVFTKDPHAHALADESVLLAVVLSHKNASYTEAMQVLDYLLRMLHVEYTVIDDDVGCFLKGRCARIVLKNGFKIAYVGEMHPHVLENFGIEMPVVGFELNLTELFTVVER